MMQELERLRHVVECQVFELCGPFEEHGSLCYYVPYMMNDAVENYLVLRDCRLVGKFQPDFKGKQEAQIAEVKDGYVFAFRQGMENAFTLFFKSIEEKKQYYRYHEIGHFWVTGQEQWRQLVYIVGTIHDKYSFLGETSCNEIEKKLLHLIEFGPFQYWSPVHGSLEEDYPESEEGICAMELLAKEAGDQAYWKWIQWYRRFPRLKKRLAKMLLSSKRERLYRYIWEKVELASSCYQERKYDMKIEEEISAARKQADSELKERGFTGSYPVYTKDKQKIQVVEEHPFTILEWNHYKFRIHFMISECRSASEDHRNSGFFKGAGRKGWIKTYDYKS